MPSTIEQDLALLVSLMADGSSDDADPNFAEMLKKLERADNVAQGVEGRLDDIIANLDTMLASLEGQARDTQGVEASGDVRDSQSNPDTKYATCSVLAIKSHLSQALSLLPNPIPLDFLQLMHVSALYIIAIVIAG
ncbi:hypothetical protein AX16_000342 [Volvariella volvacea WC 439]|nr:hypothetical protein AX16_000342 [Volvariella volvacea WC 439]